MKVVLENYMGSDLDVVNIARVSFNKESLELDRRDIKLIGYLAKHGHWTPFAHVQLRFKLQAPIFVARQLMKHQVGLVWNEVSRRYVDDGMTFHAPEGWRKRADNVKQGSQLECIENDTPIFKAYWDYIQKGVELYNYMIEKGASPEQVRMVLPISLNTEWVWTGSLVAFQRVIQLRTSPTAQYETKQLVEQMDALISGIDELKHSWGSLRDQD